MLRKKGFTLIELLVVIVIIAMLLAVLIPALKRAKEIATRVICMANQRGLSLLMRTYVTENDDKVFSSGTDGVGSSPWGWINGGGINGIETGLLYKEGGGHSLDLFKCPTGKKGEIRTYSMFDPFLWDQFAYPATANKWIVPRWALGYYPNPVSIAAVEKYMIFRYSQLSPSANRALFIDEGKATPSPYSVSWKGPRTWDPVPIRHGDGTTLVFADGHSEYWKWTDQRTIEFGRWANSWQPGEPAPDGASVASPSHWQKDMPGNEDLRKLTKAIWGSVGPDF